MNILQILPSLDVGGVETGTVDLARYLVAHGHRAIVVSSGGRLVKDLEDAGARHYVLPVGKKSLITVVRMVRELARILRNEDIDIVHARSRVPALTAYFACRATGRLFITTAHGYYKRHPLSTVMSWGRFVIVASNIMAKHMVRNFGVPLARIRLIPRGVDLSRFVFNDPAERPLRPFTMGMVSRITALKGHMDFIRAVSVVTRQIPDVKVMIVGSAPKARYREDLALLVRRLGLERTVEFTGARADVPEVMKGLDLLVSATVTPEAFGRVIIEAQASGVPVVSTRVGGVVDIIEDGVTGLLCSPFDPRDMADKILKVHGDAALRERLVEDARRRVVGAFDMESMMRRTLAVYEEALAVANILVIKLSAIGDVILSMPSLRAIRAKYPSAKIKVLVGLDARSALDGCPYIDDRIVFDHRGRDRGPLGTWRLGAALRKECFDIVFDLQNNRKSHLFAALSAAPLRYGYDNGKWSRLLNKRLKDDAPFLDPVEHQFRVLRMAGVRAQEKHLELWPSGEDEKFAERFLTDNWLKPGQELVGVNVRASARWATKDWPLQHIAELCTRLAKEFNARVVLTGAHSDAATAAEIVKATAGKPLVAAGKTDLLELAALIRRCKVFVTPDSAPMHIAAAVGTPFIALFGPTDPRRHLPEAKERIVLGVDMKCRPCYSPTCRKHVACMKKISVEQVLDAVRPFLGVKESRPSSGGGELSGKRRAE